jgi:type IV pilus assembly protein PilA
MRLRSEDGFTLLELLVVILIIGVLAGIALPLFLTQADKANDADAKSDASGLAHAMKVCYQETSDYTDCDGTGAGDKLGSTGLPVGSGAGKVDITSVSTNGFTVTATGKGAGHQYVITEASGKENRTCTGCQGGTW